MGVPDGPNQRWSLDFVSDAFTDGRRFRILTVVDDFTKENVLLVPDTSISGLRVTRELGQAFAERGMPKTIVSDNHCPAGVCKANAREGVPSSQAWLHSEAEDLERFGRRMDLPY
jgi:hypothetical protein